MPLPKSNFKGPLPPGGIYWRGHMAQQGDLNRWQKNHFRLLALVEYQEGVLQGSVERLLTRLGLQYKKADYVPSDDEIINKLFPLDKHINDLVTLNGKVAAMEQLVKENYDLKGKYRHFFQGGRLPSRMTVSMIDKYLGETGQNSPMEKWTMEAYTRRMTAELAKVTQRHIEETIAQGVAQNWSRGRKQEELRKRFLEEQAKAPGLDMSKAFPNVETVIRTESMQIMGAETYKSASESYVKGRIWGFTYNAVGDSRTRETHLAQDDCSAPFEDPFWDEWTPPNGYNCRCWLTRESEEPDSIRPPHRELKPDKGFAFNPAQLHAPVSPQTEPTVTPIYNVVRR